MSVPLRAVRLLAVPLVAALLLSACGGSSDTGSGSTGPFNLKLQQYPGVPFSVSGMVADQEGFFKKNGLNVSFVNPGDGATSMKLLANGKDSQGVVADVAGVIAARSHGQGVGLVGSVIGKSLYQVYAKKGSLLSVTGDWKTKILALKGKTVGTPGFGGSADLAMRGLIRAAGLDPDKDMTMVQVANTQAAVAQLSRGSIDAWIYVPPAGATIKKAGAGDLYFDFASEAPAEYSNAILGMLVNDSFAKKNPGVVKKWIASEDEAISWIKDPANKQAATDLIAAKVTSGDKTAAAGLLDYLINTSYASNRPGLSVSLTDLQAAIDRLVTSGAVKAGSVTTSQLIVNGNTAK